MTSRELEYIKTVADEKSISSAARKLYIAQPSLSLYRGSRKIWGQNFLTGRLPA